MNSNSILQKCFGLRELEGRLYQPKNLICPSWLDFKRAMSESIADTTQKFESKNLQGIIGEYVANQLVRHSLEQCRSVSSYIISLLSKGRKGEYVIGSLEDEIIKFDSKCAFE